EPCAALYAARLGCSAGRNPKQRRWFQLCRHSHLRAKDLFPGQLSSPIFDLHRPILPLTYQHLALRRCVLPALCLHLKQPIVVAHHPVVPDDPFGLQPEYLPQLRRARCLPVIILLLRGRPPEPPVVLRQIFPLQILVRLLVRPNLLPPPLLDQPVLMRAVVAFHSPFGLRRSRRDDLDPQLLAHPPKLCHRLFPSQLFPLRGRAFIHVLPIHVQRLRHSVFLDPRPQRVRAPPRSSPPRPAVTPPRWSRRRSCSSGSPPNLAPPTSRENFRPSAPIPQNAPAAPAAADTVSACVADSTTLPPASIAAAFPHPFATRLHSPNVPPPVSAQTALPRLPPTSPPPASSPADETSPAWLAPSLVPLRDASTLWPLPPHTSSTTAWPAGNSPPPGLPHPPPSILCSSPVPTLLPDPTPSGSSQFSPSGLLPRPFIRGHFYRGEKGTLSSRFNTNVWMW